ncbi:putative membrane protein [Frankia canadensis]|uniref:Putative membrane protein n=2 Tax=Frankia canadensis TaxID=1836972 RepID=A0A2I2L0Z2_9ACTN|nr:putative membrane protein [Frankia canadensis]SOU58874.1 putative membrane protein [Frankia canadensis]
MALGGRMDRAQRRHRGIGFVIAVLYKFGDDQGGYLAALITFYAFLSLFPLLLLLTTGLGFVLHGHHHLQEQVVSSALSQFPIIGDQLRDDVQALRGSGAAVAIGVLGAVYGSLGVARAIGNALDTAWAVPRRSRPNPFFARVRSLSLIGLLGLGVVMTTVLSTVTTGASAFGRLAAGFQVLAVAISTAGNAGLILAAFTVLTARSGRVRENLPGAVFAAVGWQAVQTLGSYYIAHQLKGSTQVYGLFGLVLGLMTWLYFLSVVVVVGMEINAVRAGRLYPRALLTPFVDDVDLTDSDRRAYTSYAQAEQFKSFQRVDVTFTSQPSSPPVPDQPAPARAQPEREVDPAGPAPAEAPSAQPTSAQPTSAQPSSAQPSSAQPSSAEAPLVVSSPVVSPPGVFPPVDDIAPRAGGALPEAAPTDG